VNKIAYSRAALELNEATLSKSKAVWEGGQPKLKIKSTHDIENSQYSKNYSNRDKHKDGLHKGSRDGVVSNKKKPENLPNIKEL
ncbi:13452_t:CDS:2, partial [Gigaspora rosea]